MRRFICYVVLCQLAITPVLRADQLTPTTLPVCLPEATSSFGAVASGGWLYVYGGHIVPTHHYSTAAVSGQFHRLKLAGGNTWEELPSGPGLQGMNLAAWGGKVYRAGGMQPRNKPGEKADNYSIADCSCFNPATMKWQAIRPLTEPRSSHDVVAIDGKLYVVGGWTMEGHAGNKWLTAMAVLDLASPQARWESIKQPFERRALTAASYRHKLYVLGGFTEESEPQLQVDIYDPQKHTWSRGPNLPGKQINGFSPAAVGGDNGLFVSVADGTLYRLDEALGRWSPVAHTTPRIVHRLAIVNSQILIIGGAARGDNLNLIESVDPADRAAESH